MTYPTSMGTGIFVQMDSSVPLTDAEIEQALKAASLKAQAGDKDVSVEVSEVSAA